MAYESKNLKESLRQFLELVIKPYYEHPDDIKTNECIEIVYDSGDLEYNKAVHRKFYGRSFEEISKAIAETVEGLLLVNSNISIIPTSILDPNAPEGRAARSKREKAYRASCWIMEIEPDKTEKMQMAKNGLIPIDPKNHSLIASMLEKVIPHLPEDIKRAVAGIYVTGGGINLIVQFSRPAKLAEIKKLSNLFKRIIKDIKDVDPKAPIDDSCYDLFHPQRIAGTLNFKYRGHPILFTDRDKVWQTLNKKPIPFEPLDIDKILEENFMLSVFGDKKTVEERLKEVLKETEEIEGTDFKRVIDELLSIVNIPSIFGLDVVKETSNYYLVRCPFHPPDNNPSMVIYKNLDKDGIQMAVDLHDQKVYNAIGLAKALYNYSGKEAVEWLAEQLGVNVAILKKRKAKKIQEEVIEDLDDNGIDNVTIESIVEKWVIGAGIDINSIGITIEEDGQRIIVAFDVAKSNRSLMGIDVIRLRLSDKSILREEEFLVRLASATGNVSIDLPAEKPREKKEFLRQVLNYFIYRAHINGRVYTAPSKVDYVFEEIIAFLNENKAIIKSIHEFMYIRTGITVIKSNDKEFFVFSLKSFSEFLRGRKIFSRITYQELRELIEKLSPKGIQLITAERNNLGIAEDLVFVPKDVYDDYVKNITNQTIKLENLDEESADLFRLLVGNAEGEVDISYEYTEKIGKEEEEKVDEQQSSTEWTGENPFNEETSAETGFDIRESILNENEDEEWDEIFDEFIGGDS